MNKTFALAILLGAAVACDPFVSDCTPKHDLPQKYGGAYWMHGIVSYIQSVYMAVIFGVYSSSLNLFGMSLLGASYAIAAANFIGYFPVAVIFTLTAAWDQTAMYKTYYRLLIASNIYGWILTCANLTWYVILVIFILLPSLFDW
jgi:hypothetical protein